MEERSSAAVRQLVNEVCGDRDIARVDGDPRLELIDQAGDIRRGPREEAASQLKAVGDVGARVLGVRHPNQLELREEGHLWARAPLGQGQGRFQDRLGGEETVAVEENAASGEQSVDSTGVIVGATELIGGVERLSGELFRLGELSLGAGDQRLGRGDHDLFDRGGAQRSRSYVFERPPGDVWAVEQQGGSGADDWTGTEPRCLRDCRPQKGLGLLKELNRRLGLPSLALGGRDRSDDGERSLGAWLRQSRRTMARVGRRIDQGHYGPER
jgi:hypothetical protein